MNSIQVFEKETNYNVKEAYNDDYNCMSFALNCFEDWFEPSEFYCLGRMSSSRDFKKLQRMAKKCVQELQDYFQLRVIKSVFDLAENEYMIAFRVSGDDFHFMRRFSDGQWYHKRGAWPIEAIDEEEVYAPLWEHRDMPYISTIFFFAVPFDYDVYNI